MDYSIYSVPSLFEDHRNRYEEVRPRVDSRLVGRVGFVKLDAHAGRIVAISGETGEHVQAVLTRVWINGLGGMTNGS